MHSKKEDLYDGWEFRWQPGFLAELEKRGVVLRAAKAAGVSRRRVYAAREKCEYFRAAWDEALETSIDSVEESAIERARDGWLEPIYHQGVKVGDIRRYSAPLTIFILKCKRPEIYNRLPELPESDDGSLAATYEVRFKHGRMETVRIEPSSNGNHTNSSPPKNGKE